MGIPATRAMWEGSPVIVSSLLMMCPGALLEAASESHATCIDLDEEKRQKAALSVIVCCQS